MEYIHLLGGNFGASLRSLDFSQETLLKIGAVVVVVFVLGMLFWRKRN